MGQAVLSQGQANKRVGLTRSKRQYWKITLSDHEVRSKIICVSIERAVAQIEKLKLDEPQSTLLGPTHKRRPSIASEAVKLFSKDAIYEVLGVVAPVPLRHCASQRANWGARV